MNEIKKFLGLFLQVFLPCVYSIITIASIIGSIAILALAPMWAWLSLLIIIPLGTASGIRLCQFIKPYLDD